MTDRSSASIPSVPRADGNPRVAYVRSGWASNIGNAFYNVGALHVLERIFGRENVAPVPDLPIWSWSPDPGKSFSPLAHLSTDLLVFSGPGLCAPLAEYESVFEAVTSRGGKLAFLSAGGANYDREEAETVRRLLRPFLDSILFVSTRDTETWETYQDLGPPVYDGICTSMFVRDAIATPELDIDDFVVFAFRRRHEPVIKFRDGAVKVRPRRKGGRFQRFLDGRPVIRARHERFMADTQRVFDRPSVFYSDLPDGYLALYRSAHAVFSDRVHACAATVALGGRAMFVRASPRSNDGRSNLLRRVGAEEAFSQPIALDQSALEAEKSGLIGFLQQFAGSK